MYLKPVIKPLEEKKRYTGPVKFSITTGMRGIFAFMYDWDGPIRSSPHSFNETIQAEKDAITWAKSEYPGDWKNRIGFPITDDHNV